MVSWIPEKYAVIGKYLELKMDGEWVNGWQVKSTSNRQSDEQLSFTKHAARNHRSVTDI